MVYRMADWTLAAILATALAGASAFAAEDPAELNNAGIAAYNQAQYDDAIDYFEDALKLSPDNDTLRRNLCNARQGAADLLAKAGDFQAASRHLERAITTDPSNPSPLVQLGAYYLRLDMVSEAISRLEEAIELKPGYLDAHELLGEAYYRDNDLPAARTQWEYVLKMAPDRPGLRERYDKAFREESIESGFKKSDSSHFKLSGPKDMQPHVRNRVLRMLEEAYREIGRKFGGVYPPAPIQVILYGSEQFTQATQLDDHVGAVYDGKIRAPLTDKVGSALPDPELKRRLTHEYVHVVVRFLGGESVPWWLNEGLAETLSTDFGEEERSLLRDAVSSGTPFDLRRLEASQLNNLGADALRIAYLESHAIANHLWSRFGQRRMQEFIGQMATGTKPEEALRAVFRRTYDTLIQEVSGSLF